jgi:hypothetical protein
MGNEKAPETNTESRDLPWNGISWWIMLIMSVLAIPSLGFVVVTITGVEDIMGVLVFMVTCWACTYFGMHLVKHPNMNEKRDFTR